MSAVINEAGMHTMPARDTITVLTCHRNLRLAKPIHPDGTVDHYDNARTYAMQDHSLLKGLDSIEWLLQMIMPDPRRCVVRGAINRKAYGDDKLILNVRRTKKDKGDDLATLIETERYWLAIDVDEAPLPEGADVKDLRACVCGVLSQLPPAFHSADYIVQASGRHGLTPGIRVRLWFWLSRPLGEKALKGWFADVDFVDRSIFNCAQVIYTATPEFAGGRQDHLPERLVHVRQGQPVVQVPDALPEARPDAKPGERGYVPKFTPIADADAEAALAEAAEWVQAQKPGNRHGAVLEVTASLARRFIVHGRLPRDQVLTEIALALVDAGRGKDEAIDEVERALGGILESLQRDIDELIKHPIGDHPKEQPAQGEGTGKGTLARALLHIFGQHGLAISQAKHLVGNFNSHLRDCSFLFSDEAFFAGDKQHVGVLKSIITEPHLTIEGKFQNAVQTPNFLHVMMASNEDWVVPAAIDSRRFFVLQVSDQRKDDHAYFDAIWRQMKAGGYEAMLHDLQTHDLTTFNVRRCR
jgi:hypothetical protein